MNVAILSQKGGVGKTTLSLNLAAARLTRWRASESKNRLSLLDLDDQESLYRFRKSLKRADFESVDLAKLPLSIEKHSAATDIIMDAPRSLDDALTLALMSRSDAVLIPFLPEYDAILAAKRTLDVAKRVKKEINREFKFRAVLMANSSAAHRPALAREARELFAPYVCKTAIPSTPIAGAAAYAGQSILEFAPDSPIARAFLRLESELSRVWRWA